MGWVLLPIVLISSLLLMSVALIINNIETQYPLYWIKATELDGDAEEKQSIEQSELDTRSRAWLSDTTLASLTIPEKAYLPV